MKYALVHLNNCKETEWVVNKGTSTLNMHTTVVTKV